MNDTTIVCPHCFNEAVHSLRLTAGSKDSIGTALVLCENCYKKFRVYFQGGKLNSVKRT